LAFKQFDDLLGRPPRFEKLEQIRQILAFEQRLDRSYEIVGIDRFFAQRLMLGLL